MPRVASLFSAEDRQRITQAVTEAESRTSAEIVPVVAGSSGRYDRPEDLVGLWTAMLLMAGVWYALPERATSEPGSWGGPPDWIHLAALIAAAVAGFILGAIVGSRVGWLRRLFTPARQMREEVLGRSRHLFYDNRVHHTAGATGLLIYVSLFERMAAVVADEAVLAKLGQSALDDLCARLTADLRSAGFTAALCNCIQSAGNRLSPVLPRASDDVNELSDALVVLE